MDPASDARACGYREGPSCRFDNPMEKALSNKAQCQNCFRSVDKDSWKIVSLMSRSEWGHDVSWEKSYRARCVINFNGLFYVCRFGVAAHIASFDLQSVV